MLQTSFLIGTAWTSAHTAAIMQSLGPVLGCWVPVLLGQERMRLTRVLAGVFASASVLVLCKDNTGDPDVKGEQKKYFLGLGLLAFQQVCITFNAVVQKRLVCAYPPIFVTALGTLWGGVFNFTYLAVVSAFFGLDMDLESLWRSGPGLFGLAYSVLVVTCLAYSLKAVGIGLLSVSASMAYHSVQPVVSTILAAVYLEEAITSRSLMGIGGVVAALLLLSVEGTALGKYFVTDARTYSIDTQNGDLTTELRMCEMQERERSVSISSHPADPRTFSMSSAISA